MRSRLFPSLTILFLLAQASSLAQKATIVPDLSHPENLLPVNRKIDINRNNGKSSVHLNAAPNEGLAWIKNVHFGRGTIELDIKGKNLQQQSFVGIAFHGIHDSTFDVIYFRPFNFASPDTARRRHSVQYVSLPQYDWSALRTKFPGKYENELNVKVDPESWFHAKIVVANDISVYVNGDAKPSLVLLPLNNRQDGTIGFWVGNNAEGDFANLSIQNQ
jgi:hypothetical protein